MFIEMPVYVSLTDVLGILAALIQTCTGSEYILLTCGVYAMFNF